MVCKCGQKLPLMKRVCDECKRKYQFEYSLKNKDKKLETSREWMRTRRWLDGGERWDDLGPEISGPIKKAVNGELKLLYRRTL